MKHAGLMTIIAAAAIAVAGCGERKEAPERLSRKTSAPPARPTAAAPAASAQRGEAMREPTAPLEELSAGEIDAISADLRDKLSKGEPVTTGRGPDALMRLGRSGNPRGVPVLAEILSTSKDPVARRQAAQALGMLRDPSSVEALKGALGDEYMWVRLVAALSLTRLGEKQLPLGVFSEVIRGTGSGKWKVTLPSTGGPRRSAEQEERRADMMKKQTFPMLALSGLESIGTPASLDIVKAAASSDNRYVRQMAERILARSGREGGRQHEGRKDRGSGGG